MQAVTIHLPEKLYEQLRRTAALSQQPLDAVVAHSLAHSLPPLLEEIPADYQVDVYPLLEMGDEALQCEIQRTFPAEAWAEYEALLQRKQERPFTDAERTRLEELRHQADVLTLRKGYAAVLLKRRGYSIPTRSQLPAVQ